MSCGLQAAQAYKLSSVARITTLNLSFVFVAVVQSLIASGSRNMVKYVVPMRQASRILFSQHLRLDCRPKVN